MISKSLTIVLFPVLFHNVKRLCGQLLALSDRLGPDEAERINVEDAVQ